MKAFYIKRGMRLLYLLVVLCSVTVTQTFAQAVGDYGSNGAMDWLTGTWKVCATAGTWTGATTTTTAPTSAKNVWIFAGDVVTLTSPSAVTGGFCKNLEVAGTLTLVDFRVENTRVYGNIHVASTGTITANPKFAWGDNTNASTTAMALTVDAGGVFLLKDQFKLTGASGTTTTITNNGILGASSAVAGSGATMYIINSSSAVGNSNVTFTGSGTTIFKALASDTNAGTFSITADQDMTFSPASGSVGIKLQNASGATATSTRTFTINAGKKVSITSGGWFANTASFSGNDASNTFNINGTLDVSQGSIFFGSTSSTTSGNLGTTNSQIINIGSSGVLKCGSTVRVNKAQSGQTLAVNVAEGGKIIYVGNAYQTLPTSATYSVTGTPSSLLTNSNSNLEFPGTSALTLTLNSALSANNLSFGAAATLSGLANTTVNGTLTLGGLLTNNTGNIVLGNAASFSGSTSNYIDLSSGGGLVRNSVGSTATLFPIGAGSYTPLLLSNTTGAPNITIKVKNSIDNAVEDATGIVNLQWSVVSSAATTSDIKFQFNSANQAASFNPATSLDLGNYTNAWAAISTGTATGSNPYALTVSNLSIPTTNNLYVLGNTGKVVRLAPTVSTWTGSVDTDWAKSSNWSNGVPDNTLDAVIPASLTNYPVINLSASIKGLSVAAGAGITNNSVLNINGASIAVNGNLAGSGIYALTGAAEQTITGTFAVQKLSVNNLDGVKNDGVLLIDSTLTILSGALTGTAPVYTSNFKVSYEGASASSAGLWLSPSAGNIASLTVNSAGGSLILANAASVKDLSLINGSLNNNSANITITNALTRNAGAILASPIYSGTVAVNIVGSSGQNSGPELSPASGSMATLNLNGTGIYTLVSAVSTSTNLAVNSGTFKLSSNFSCANATVASGATISSDAAASSFTRRTLTLGNAATGNDAVLTVNGTLGSATRWSTDGLDLEVHANAKKFTINGSGGTVGIACLRPAANADARALDIVINQDITLNRDNGGAANIEPALTLQNGTGTYARTLTIPTGVTVTFRGNAGLHGLKNASSSADELLNNYASSSANQGNINYIISGTLDLSYTTGTVFNLNTTSFSGNLQSVLVTVKNGGNLKLGNIVKLHTAQAGQLSNIVAEDGSNVVFNTNSAQTILQTGSALPVLTFSNLNLNNTSGLVLARSINIGGTLTLSNGSISGSAVVMNGTSAQAINPNGNSVENLTINNQAGITGSPSVTGTLTLIKGDVADYANLSNVNIVFNGDSVQTTHSGLTSVKNLTINNAKGLTMGAALTVNGVLSIASGKLSLANNNLTIWSTGSVSAPSASSYIVTNGSGLLVMNTPAAISTVFPVGTATSFNPVTINPTTATSFYVGVTEGNTPALPTDNATILPAKSVKRTWNISPAMPSATTVTLAYDGVVDANTEFDNTGSDVALLHYNSSSNWEYVGTGAVTPGIGQSTAKTATIENVTNFSPFTLVNPGPGAVYVNSTGSSFSDIFRSVTSGSWNGSTTWELYDAVSDTWASTVLSPGSTSTVTVRSGNTVTLTAQSGIGKLTIESGAVLTSSVSAYTAAPIVLSVGKVSSSVINNGVFGIAKGSAAGTVGDGISLVIAPNCTSFSLTGSGETGIGSLLAEGGSNNLVVSIGQNVQLRRTTASGKQVALSLADQVGAASSGLRTFIIEEGKTVSFLNSNSCLHNNSFSSAGSFSAEQGNITYDVQGTLDLKGGNIYITSSSNASSANQVVKFNIGKKGKVLVGGDFSMAKIQASQAVYVNMEDGAVLDASTAALGASNFYGPSTNATTGYGSNYVWVITNGAAQYKRLSGSGASTKTFNVAVAPADNNYVSLTGNPVAIGTNRSDLADVYSVGVNVGHPYSFTSFSSEYAINRTWKIVPSREEPYGTFLKFGFTGGSTDAKSLYSPTYPAVTSGGVADSYEVYAGTTIPAGATELYSYMSLSSRWINFTALANTVPVAGTMGTTWQLNANMIGAFVSPYVFTFRNVAAPLICTQ